MSLKYDCVDGPHYMMRIYKIYLHHIYGENLMMLSYNTTQYYIRDGGGITSVNFSGVKLPILNVN